MKGRKEAQERKYRKEVMEGSGGGGRVKEGNERRKYRKEVGGRT